MRRPVHPRGGESGYALLLVFSMAAIVAIMLYSQVPRVAFEAQRDKEQLLIDRGEQYTRAVQLFVRKFNRFPQDVAALENTSQIRFLRKKYKDPMTGKDEWREVHVGPGGVFTDSLVYGKKKGNQNAPQTFIAEMQQVGGNVNTGNQEGVNLATRRRASEQPGAPGDPNNAGNGAGQLPGQFSGQPGYPASGQANIGSGQTATINGPVMVLPDGRVVPASVNGQGAGNPAGQGVFSGQPGQVPPGQFPQGQFPQGQVPPGQQQPGQQPGPYGFPPGVQLPPGIGVQSGGGFGSGFNPGQINNPNNPGQANPNGLPNGFQNQPNGPPGAAANLINQILTSPRPGGLNGTGTGTGTDTGNNTGTPIGQGLGGQTIGGGFAGVASKYEQEGIKVYKEKTAYNEWEFVYDMTKDTTRGGGGRGPTLPVPQSTTSKQ